MCKGMDPREFFLEKNDCIIRGSLIRQYYFLVEIEFVCVCVCVFFFSYIPLGRFLTELWVAICNKYLIRHHLVEFKIMPKNTKNP